jgi:transcriptional regulator with XRE-family HTH domain
MFLSIGQTLPSYAHAKVMPKCKASKEARAFGARMVQILADGGQRRQGAGAYLAKRYKVSAVTANDWLNGRFRPGTDTARQIAEDHGTTFEALYFGTTTKSANPSSYRVMESTAADGATAIVFVDARGSCGGGSTAEPDARAPLMKEPGWFLKYNIKPQHALAVWADGDSMADFIVDGDIVIFDTSKRTPRSGRIFLIDHPDGLRIKRLRRDIDGSWMLESSNPDKRRFPDERIAPEQADLLTIRGEFVYRQGG